MSDAVTDRRSAAFNYDRLAAANYRDANPDSFFSATDDPPDERTYRRVYWAINGFLDESLGESVADGSGGGLVDDVGLLGDQRNAALVDLEKLRSEVETLRNEVPYLVSAKPNTDGEFEVQTKGGHLLMKSLAVELAKLLDAEGGGNYVQWDVKPAGQIEPYQLILVRPGGKSPHELRREAEQDLLDAERELEAVREERDDLRAERAQRPAGEDGADKQQRIMAAIHGEATVELPPPAADFSAEMEIRRLSEAVNALMLMTEDGQQRALRYLVDRFGED